MCFFDEIAPIPKLKKGGKFKVGIGLKVVFVLHKMAKKKSRAHDPPPSAAPALKLDFPSMLVGLDTYQFVRF